jgi:hypothetical protein
MGLFYSSNLSYVSNENAFHLSEKSLQKVQADPHFIIELYEGNKGYLTRALGKPFNHLNNEGRKLVFASLISYQLKPYGSNPTHAKNLLQALSLSCQEYATLTNQLYRTLSPHAPIEINFAGWNDGAVGNHVQIFARFTGEPIMVDPTIGLLAKTTFNDIVSGKPIASENIKSFYSRNDIDALNDAVKQSILHGDYKPMDLLYFYTNVQLYPDLSTLLSHCKSNFCDTPQSGNINALFRNKQQYGAYSNYVSEMRQVDSSDDNIIKLIPWDKTRWSSVNLKSNIVYTVTVKTDASTSAYQLASKTIHLSPGSYRLFLEEKITKGAQTVSIQKMNCKKSKNEKCREDNFIFSASFIDKQFDGKLKKFFIPFDIEKGLNARILLSNLSLDKKSSQYIIKEISLEKMV